MDYLWSGLFGGLNILFSGDAEAYSAVWATVGATTMAMAVSLGLGVPLGVLLGWSRFKGKPVVRTLINTQLSLPTVVIGLLVYAFLTAKGPLGDWELLFTLPGIAVGQTILALPIVVALTTAAVEGLDDRIKPTLRTLGATERQVLATCIWEARYAILAAAAAAYGRVVSEVGISMMIGGNIKWHTRTITTAIALETGKGEFAVGIALGLVLMVMALAVNVILSTLTKRAAGG